MHIPYFTDWNDSNAFLFRGGLCCKRWQGQDLERNHMDVENVQKHFLMLAT